MSNAAKEYGGALFSLAHDEQLDLSLFHEVRTIRALFSENPDYVRLLSCPNIPREERLSCLDRLLLGKVHPYVLNFLKILVEQRHISEVDVCFGEYERLYYETNGIIRAKVESAVPLTDAQKERLCKRLCAMTGAKVELVCTVNEALLGGVRLTVNNRLYEGSVKAKLASIGESLASVTL